MTTNRLAQRWPSARTSTWQTSDLNRTAGNTLATRRRIAWLNAVSLPTSRDIDVVDAA
jgi:hypothetical protein